MSRGKRRIVNLTSEEIKAKIESNTKSIDELSVQIKNLKLENKSLAKDLVIAEKREKEEAAKKQYEQLADLIKNSGKSMEEIMAFLEK